MEQSKLNEILELHKKWLKNEDGGVRATLTGANLTRANLRYANLTHADLTHANLDFSVLPLWCGGLNFTINKKQAKQLMYHVVNLMQHSKIDMPKDIFKWLEDSHVVTFHGLPKLEEK